MNEIRELRNNISASIYMMPCEEPELIERDFLKTISAYGIGMMIQQLEKMDAIYYKGEVMHIYKEWAKKNLQEYEFDFRTKEQIKRDAMSDFERKVYDSQKNRY